MFRRSASQVAAIAARTSRHSTRIASAPRMLSALFRPVTTTAASSSIERNVFRLSAKHNLVIYKSNQLKIPHVIFEQDLQTTASQNVRVITTEQLNALTNGINKLDEAAYDNLRRNTSVASEEKLRGLINKIDDHPTQESEIAKELSTTLLGSRNGPFNSVI